MQPVRVKYYGLLALTRRQYLFCQAVLLVLFLIVMVVMLALPMPDALREAARTDFKAGLIKFLWDNFLWIGLVVLVLEGIETVIMLQKFARQEAGQRAGLPGTEPTAGPK
jgi:TRAP-type mannitol/chloroaromatic compound transport system permease small subunit